MSSVVIGQWEFDVDREAADAYYKAYLPAPDDEQAYRNYLAFLQTLTEEESSFFSSLAVRPEAVMNFNTSGRDRQGISYCSGIYRIFARVLKKPKQAFLSEEEALAYIEQETSEDEPGNVELGELRAGRFSLYPHILYNPADKNGPPPDTHDFIFFVQIPWLLDQECNNLMYEPPKWWEISKRISQTRKNLEYRKELEEDAHKRLVTALNCMYERLSKEEAVALHRRWFMEFVPKGVRKKARCICFTTWKLSNYLWHAFSYDLVASQDCEDARAAFDQESKCKTVYIMMEFPSIIAYRVPHPNNLKAAMFDDIDDVYVFDGEFTYTYVHTHEEGMGLGPYFLKKS